jgi:hypothetical protein
MPRARPLAVAKSTKIRAAVMAHAALAVRHSRCSVDVRWTRFPANMASGSVQTAGLADLAAGDAVTCGVGQVTGASQALGNPGHNTFSAARLY